MVKTKEQLAYVQQQLLWRYLNTIEDNLEGYGESQGLLRLDQLQAVESLCRKLGLSLRYFSDYGDIELTREEFLAAEGAIEYERHTMFTNGVSQVCLTRVTA
jgi:hypothetical protein